MGKPTYILIVRHGESLGNCDKRVNSHTPNHLVELTERGHLQALRAGTVLADFVQNPELQDCNSGDGKRNKKSIMFYTSPYLRTRQTCNNIIEGIKDLPDVDYCVREETRMREQDFGNFQKSAEEMEKIWEERAHYGHFFYRIPHGESAADVYDRVASLNESLYRQFRQDDFPNILVLVTHGIWSRVFLMKWFKWTYEEFESLKNIPHCKYLVMKRDSKASGYKLKSKLETWDDLSEAELQNEVLKAAKEASRQVNANNDAGDVITDLELQPMIEAQKDAVETLREKNKKIKDTYKKIRSSSNSKNSRYKDKLISKFKQDTLSDCTSVESFDDMKS
ncbi:hypothetical protein PVL30_003766 [Lodderomyces elongisporus]|uniref:uncharacterized protein n=1 Tax=Lodderomyces elongisporus TaxID=36914 RepID=UPI00291F8CA6|nr:uncharacterized protein PVL30_003766 [Lodderomyces elongisporus]WLF79998.1 hypothetical protein PVL30_003766 [Lodderomyces elongisporus]